MRPVAVILLPSLVSAFRVIFTHEVASVNFYRPNLARSFLANSTVKFCVCVCVCVCVSTESHLTPKRFLGPQT
jgi:hypothetical protein